MNEEIILTVLNEVLEELKEANRSLKMQGERIGELEARIQTFEQKEIKVELPDLEPVTTAVLQEVEEIRKEMTTGMVKIALAMEVQPKAIVRRIALFPFPEYDGSGNSKRLIRWFFGTIIGAFVIGVVYLLVSQYIRIHY